MVEVQCVCEEPRYFTNTGNDEEARIRFIDKILGIKKPGITAQIEPLGIRQKFKEQIKRAIPKNKGIEEFFPKKFTPRQIQVDLWNEIQSCLNSGYKKIILSAPTGVGKSLLAASLANQLGSSFIVTSTKNL